MKRKIEHYLLKEQFSPTIIGIILNPFFFARRAIYSNVKRNSHFISGRTLDIGCGSMPYKNLFSSDEYIGIDTMTSGHNHNSSVIDILYDGKTIPFNDDHFESIVCFEVLEHIFEPDSFLSESYRVLKPGGRAMFTVPFIWDEHEQPFDYARYSTFGLTHLFEKAGFSIIKNEKYVADLSILPLMLNLYIYKIFRRIIKSRLSYLFILPLTSLNNVLGHLLKILPGNKDLYYGNIFILEK